MNAYFSDCSIGASDLTDSRPTTQAQRRRPRDAPMATATARRRSLQRRVAASLELLAASCNDSVILAVMTNPKPDNVRTILDGSGAIMDPDTN